MAYGLKYYKEFAWTNYANDTTGNTRIEILENNYSGASVEIDELGETPVQLRLDNTGDMINQTIKKTSLVLSIIDTDQFDYSQFYTSDGKKYKVNLISSVANWTGYLVPQSFGQELGVNGLISITASDGLHLLQGIDYVADKNKTLKLADFIADIETKIGLGTFDRSVSLTTDKGDLWQQFIYEGMFLDKNYEDCLDMVLTAYGLQVRYWKLFPVTSILSHSFSGSVKCLDNVPMVDYLPIAKKLKINQNLTALPDILEDAMVNDATDIIQRTPAYWKLAKWVTVSDNGLPVYPYKDRQASENMYKTISMYAIPTNAPYDTQRITGHEGSKYILREFDSTAFQIEFNANFGRLSVYGRSSETGYQEKLRPISWSQLHWGLYDTKTNKSFSKATNSWSITGRPTYSTANILRVDNPADSDVTVYINVPKTTGDVLGLELFLFTPSFAYNNPASEATNGIFSINSIKIAEIGGVSENELYNEIKGTITVGDNIDIIEYDYELGTSPSYPTNTSLYYGSSLYNNIYDQITSFTLAGNSVNQMQYLANTILYSNGAGRKSVFSGTFAPMNNGNLMFYRANVNNVNCLINSFTLDVRRVKFVDAEFVEITPFTFTNYTITSESSIGSSDWGGSGGSSGTVGGGGSTVDTSNFVVKTGSVAQNIEGSVTVEGAVVAGATNNVLPDDLPVATGSLYGVVKFDAATLGLNGSGQLTVIGGGWSNVSWGTPTAQYSPLTINSVTRNLSVDGHTHSYLPLSGGQLTGQLSLLQGAGGGIIFPNDSFGGGGDSASIKLLNPIGGESTEMTFTMTNDADDIINFSVPSIDGVKVNRYTVWNAGNFNPYNYLPLSGGNLTGTLGMGGNVISMSPTDYIVSESGDWLNHVTRYGNIQFGPVNSDAAHIYTDRPIFYFNKNISVNGYSVWHAGNDGSGSGLDADLLDGLHSSDFARGGSVKYGFNNNGWKRIARISSIQVGDQTGTFYINNQFGWSIPSPIILTFGLGYRSVAFLNQLGGISGTVTQARIVYSSNVDDLYFEVYHNGGTSNPMRISYVGMPLAELYTSEVIGEIPSGYTSFNLTLKDNQLTGNVDSADKLKTSRTLWGQLFDGTGNVSGPITVDLGATNGYVFNLTSGGINTTIGSLNNSWFHFNTNAPNGFYFYQEITSASKITATTGIFSNLTANYIPKHTVGGLSNSLIYDNATYVGIGTTSPSYKLDVNGTFRATGAAYLNSTLSVIGASTFTGLLTANGGINATTGVFSSYVAAQRFYAGYDSGLANAISCSNWFRSNGTTGWINETYVAGINSDAANVVRTYSTNKFKVYNTEIDSILTLGGVTAANVVSSGAVVAGALNGTLPNDLPVATNAVFGVVKTGASINNNAGVVNLNGRHYTTTSTYTDAAVREITAELALGTGSMANGTLDQIQLSFAPLTTTRGLTANVIATDTGAGMGLKLSFRKDAGTGRWYIMIYNDSGAAVTRDGILLSIRGQQTI